MKCLYTISAVVLGMGIANGQAAVESATVTAAGAGAAAAGASGAGKGVAGVFGALNSTLEKKAPAGTAETQAPPGAASPVSAPAPRRPIDPSKITYGMTVADLDKLGAVPTFSAQKRRKEGIVETLWYPTPADGELRIELVDGKVVSAKLSTGRDLLKPGIRPERR